MRPSTSLHPLLAFRAGRPRGQVGALLTWLIVFLVLMMVAWGLFFASRQDTANALARERAARQDLAAMTERRDQALADQLELAAVLGFSSPDSPGESDAVAARAAIDAAAADVGLTGENVTVEQVLAALRTELQNKAAALASASTDLAAAVSARQAAEQASATLESNYRAQLDTINQQLQDAEDRAASDTDTLQARIDELLNAERDAQNEVSTAQRELGDLELQLERSRSTAEATIRALGEKRQQLEPEAADGEILAVGRDGGTAFVDIGGRDGLKLGTRFEVLRRGKGGALRSLGTVEVQEVESSMAVASLVGRPDPQDPILPGDMVRNPHFARQAETHFYLLGEFPLGLSREFIEQRLAELGAVVDESIGVQTDVLVLGHQSLAEGEFATPLTDTEEFAMADRLGVRVMRLDELSRFLHY